MTTSFDEALRAIIDSTRDGTLLRGEVLARWHEFVGTGQFMRAMEEKVSWLRDRVVGAIRGTPPEADKVSVAVESGLETIDHRTLTMADYVGPTERRRLFERELM